METYETDEEMKLLDQFAAAALPAVIMKESNFTNFAQIAEYCYTFAQARENTNNSLEVRRNQRPRGAMAD